MYRRLASVRVSPRWANQASLSCQYQFILLERGPGRKKKYHFSHSAYTSVVFPAGRSMTPSTSPSVNPPPISLSPRSLFHTASSQYTDIPMLCLYKPYNFNLSAVGGLAVPVRGIRFTVLRAWTKTRSVVISHQHTRISLLQERRRETHQQSLTSCLVRVSVFTYTRVNRLVNRA